MRPRRGCRGELSSRLRYSTWQARFNAATARMPWRTPDFFRPAVYAVIRLQCGHGEDAVENLAAVLLEKAGVDASMRPRRGCRGELAKPAGPTGRPISLQCGHGEDAVENTDLPSGLSLSGDASMRPRRGCRGEQGHGPGKDYSADASMPPRRGCRGEH